MKEKIKYSVEYTDQAIAQDVTKEEMIHILLTMVTGFADPERVVTKPFTITFKGIADGHTN